MFVVVAALLLTLVTVFTVVFRPPTTLLRWLSGRTENTLFILATDRRRLALTIDDAPHPDVTPDILAVLRRHAVRVTFFVIGRNAELYPDILDTIRADGHELANHTYEDRLTIRLREDAFQRSVTRTDALIAPTGPIKWCRPGGGALSGRLARLMRQHGYAPCLATAYPLDLRFGVAVARLQFVANVRPGAILVLHDGAADRRRTVQILEDVLPRVLRRGYEFVTLTELVSSADPDETA